MEWAVGLCELQASIHSSLLVSVSLLVIISITTTLSSSNEDKTLQLQQCLAMCRLLPFPMIPACEEECYKKYGGAASERTTPITSPTRYKGEGTMPSTGPTRYKELRKCMERCAMENMSGQFTECAERCK